MHLERVVGTVVAAEKTPNLEGVRFLIVQPLTRDLADRGRPVIAAQAMPEPFVPVDHAIVGIVDQLAVEPLPKPPPKAKKSEARQ